MRLYVTHQLIDFGGVHETAGWFGMWVLQKGLTLQRQQASNLVLFPLLVVTAGALARSPRHHTAAVQADHRDVRRCFLGRLTTMMDVILGGSITLRRLFGADFLADAVDVAAADGDITDAPQHFRRHLMGFDLA